MEQTPLGDRLGEATTYAALMRAARMWEDRTALLYLPRGRHDDVPESLSYGELGRQITRAANLFTELGVGRHDVVSLMLPGLLQTQVALWGAEAAGIANPINPHLQPRYLADILARARTRVLVSVGPDDGDGIWARAVEACTRLDDPPRLVCIDTPRPPAGALSFETELERQVGDRLQGPAPKGDDIAAYFHTGGSTGAPKLAAHRHRGQVVQAWNTAAMMGIDDHGVMLAGLPVYHIGNTIVVCLRGFLVGDTVVMLSPNGFRNPAVIEDFWRICARFRATGLSTVPTALAAVLATPVGDADISALRVIATGGAAVPHALLARTREVLGLEVAQGWGLTETTSYATLNPARGQPRPGSAGFRVPYHRVRTVRLDERGDIAGDCPPGEIGLIAVQGPGVFPGYVDACHNADAFLADPDSDGDPWLNTGDLGRLDDDGYLWITGRARDMIIRGGHNIDPAIIEEALARHPAVEMVAAVGQIDAYAGELPIAYVQPRPGAEVEPQDLAAFARKAVAERGAAPVRVIVREHLPLTGVGKIFKPELRRDAARHALEAALEAIDTAGAQVRVRVDDDDEHGTLAVITLAGVPEADLEDLRDRVAGIIGAFPIACRIDTVPATGAGSAAID